jgi:hypothetical protein
MTIITDSVITNEASLLALTTRTIARELVKKYPKQAKLALTDETTLQLFKGDLLDLVRQQTKLEPDPDLADRFLQEQIALAT